MKPIVIDKNRYRDGVNGNAYIDLERATSLKDMGSYAELGDFYLNLQGKRLEGFKY